jgi:hypothetical protein
MPLSSYLACQLFLSLSEIVAKIKQFKTMCDAMEKQIISATDKQITLLEALLKGV